MGTKEKLIARFKSNPKDFTWDEFVRLFSILGYEIDNKGKTSDARTIFFKRKISYTAQKPEAGNMVKNKVIKQELRILIKNETK